MSPVYGAGAARWHPCNSHHSRVTVNNSLARDHSCLRQHSTSSPVVYCEGRFALPDEKAGVAFSVADAFVVKYNAAAGQRELKPHRDGSVFSFNVALNALSEYEGGGTFFRTLEQGEGPANYRCRTDCNNK
eukprot:5967677-Pyramimonas_sp.AAC.1